MLKRISESIFYGNYDEAWKFVTEYQKEEKKDTNAILFDLMQVELLIKLGKFSEALNIILSYFSEITIDQPSIYLRTTYLLMEIFWLTGRFEEALEIGLYVEDNFHKNNFPKNFETEAIWGQDFGRLLNLISISYRRKGFVGKALEYAQKAYPLREKYGTLQDLAFTIENYGIIESLSGNYEKSFSYLQHALEMRLKYKNKQDISHSHYYIGMNYLLLGNFERALEKFSKSLELRESIKNEQDIAESLNGIGLVHSNKGNLDLALEYFSKAYEISKRNNDNLIISDALNYIGHIHQLKGNLKLALQCFEESFTLGKLFKTSREIALALDNLGELYKLQGRFNKAIKCFDEAKTIIIDENPQLLAQVMFHKYQALIITNEIYKDMLQDFKDLNSNYPQIKFISYLTNLSVALFLKEEKSFSDLVKAQKILKDLEKDDWLVGFEYTIARLEILAELQILEAKINETDSFINDLYTTINNLLQIAKSNHLYPVYVKTMIILSKLSIIQNETIKSKYYLDEAYNLATSHNLDGLLPMVVEEQKKFTIQRERWESVVYNRNLNLFQKLEQTGITDYIMKLKIIKTEYEEKKDIGENFKD